MFIPSIRYLSSALAKFSVDFNAAFISDFFFSVIVHNAISQGKEQSPKMWSRSYRAKYIYLVYLEIALSTSRIATSRELKLFTTRDAMEA